ncbi:MAG: GNAT family N-acetyltransferase [Candidatus Aquicultorales bacterium]
MRSATERELARVWSLVEHMRPFPTPAAFEYAIASGSVQAVCCDDDPLGAALLGRWRKELPIGWIRAFSAGRRPHVFVQELAEKVLDEGDTGVLSPLVARSVGRCFERAGFELFEPVSVLQLKRIGRAPSVSPAEIRPLGIEELSEALKLDRESFSDFWAFGPDELVPLLEGGPAFGALLNGSLVGYTVLTIDAGKGVLVRLAVTPARRRLGIGRQLVGTALAWLKNRQIDSVLLTTQEENAAARALYESFGFRQTGTQYLYMFTR